MIITKLNRGLIKNKVWYRGKIAVELGKILNYRGMISVRRKVSIFFSQKKHFLNLFIRILQTFNSLMDAQFFFDLFRINFVE